MKERTKIERNHYYLVITDSGYYAIYDGQQCQQTIVGRDETEARAMLRKWQNPVKERLPYRKDLAEQVDEIIDRKEAGTPKGKALSQNGQNAPTA